jgi:peptidoglycan/LPS O-acetylase OafA/YrhL
MKTGSVKQRLDYYNGVVPGFDALRLLLATSILLYHCSILYHPFSFEPDYFYGSHRAWLEIPLRALLCMFFFLSGFLVTASALRTKSLKTFLLFRAFRIVPALAGEILLSAVVLGSWFTTLPLGKYYAHPKFMAYFLNIFGFIHWKLPGVFRDGGNPAINANLWTLPPELYSYILLAFLFALGFLFRREWLLRLFLLSSLSAVVLAIKYPAWMIFSMSPVPLAGPMLVYSFFIGVVTYLFADRIHLRKTGLILSLLGLVFIKWNETIPLGTWAASYLCLYLGFIDLRKFSLVRRGDYSYGIYLYSFPLQQSLIRLVPWCTVWWKLFLVAFPVTLLFAIFSWHVIEKPFQRLKSRFGGARASETESSELALKAA